MWRFFTEDVLDFETSFKWLQFPLNLGNSLKITDEEVKLRIFYEFGHTISVRAIRQQACVENLQSNYYFVGIL